MQCIVMPIIKSVGKLLCCVVISTLFRSSSVSHAKRHTLPVKNLVKRRRLQRMIQKVIKILSYFNFNIFTNIFFFVELICGNCS
jgi:p-aminobenzoyl-glutamate transporter AbgT